MVSSTVNTIKIIKCSIVNAAQQSYYSTTVVQRSIATTRKCIRYRFSKVNPSEVDLQASTSRRRTTAEDSSSSTTALGDVAQQTSTVNV